MSEHKHKWEADYEHIMCECGTKVSILDIPNLLESTKFIGKTAEEIQHEAAEVNQRLEYNVNMLLGQRNAGMGLITELERKIDQRDEELNYRRAHPNDPLMQGFVSVGFKKEGKITTIHDTARTLRCHAERLKNAGHDIIGGLENHRDEMSIRLWESLKKKIHTWRQEFNKKL